MLYHVTMRHTADDCPGYSPSNLPAFIEVPRKLERLRATLSVTEHFLVWDSAAHTGYALIEADHTEAVKRYLAGLPIRQHLTIMPVDNFKDIMTLLRNGRPERAASA